MYPGDLLSSEINRHKRALQTPTIQPSDTWFTCVLRHQQGPPRSHARNARLQVLVFIFLFLFCLFSRLPYCTASCSTTSHSLSCDTRLFLLHLSPCALGQYQPTQAATTRQLYALSFLSYSSPSFLLTSSLYSIPITDTSGIATTIQNPDTATRIYIRLGDCPPACRGGRRVQSEVSLSSLFTHGNSPVCFPFSRQPSGGTTVHTVLADLSRPLFFSACPSSLSLVRTTLSPSQHEA